MLNYNQNGQFDFRETYGDVNNSGNYNTDYVRIAYIQHLLTPSTQNFDQNTINIGKFPMFLTPDKGKIALTDVEQILASHYKEYPDYDPYTRYNKDETQKTFYYPVSNVRTSNGHITMVGNTNNPDIDNVEYIALGMPAVSFFLPVYYGVSVKPKQLTGAIDSADRSKLFWQFRMLQTLVFLSDQNKNIPFDFESRSTYVQQQYAPLIAELEQDRKNLEISYKNNHQPELINDFTQNSILKISKLTGTMITHFMQELDVNKKYSLNSETARSSWFTNTLHQQDCNYQTTHCGVTATLNSSNRFVDRPML